MLAGYCATRPDDHGVCEAGGQIRDDRPDLQPTSDPRIRAYAVMAPLSVLFSGAGLAGVGAPFLIFVAGDDHQLSPAENSLALAKALPQGADLETIGKADHFVFLAPCSAQLTRSMPALCTDPAGIDRKTIHAEINRKISNFFAASLPPAQ